MEYVIVDQFSSSNLLLSQGGRRETQAYDRL